MMIPNHFYMLFFTGTMEHEKLCKYVNLTILYRCCIRGKSAEK